MSSSGICEYSPTGALVPYSKMDRNGSRLSISDIPRELISEIFLFFCTEFLPLSLPPQLLLTQICAYWRAVAHRTPRLWTQLSMNMRTGKFPHHTELITAWLKRSGSLPLDIKMMVAKGQGKRLKNPLKAVIPFIHRWRCFEVDSPLHILRPLLLLPKPSAPLLEHVCIHVRQVTERSLEWFKRDAQQRLAKNGAAFSCFLGAPRLYSLHAGVSHDSRRGGRSPLPLDTFIPYKQITHLTLGEFESVNLPEFGHHFLTLFSNHLVYLAITIPLLGQRHLEEIPSVVNMPQLRTLKVFGFNNGIGQFLSHLKLPSLKHLSVISHAPSDAQTLHPELVALCYRSSFKLEVLVLHNTLPEVYKAFYDLLMTLPSLRKMDLYERSCLVFHPIMKWIRYAEWIEDCRAPEDQHFAKLREVGWHTSVPPFQPCRETICGFYPHPTA